MAEIRLPAIAQRALAALSTRSWQIDQNKPIDNCRPVLGGLSWPPATALDAHVGLQVDIGRKVRYAEDVQPYELGVA